MSRQEFIAAYGLKPLVYIPELPPDAKVIFLALYLLIFVLALLGNIIIRRKAMRTATNIFICSLACSDLLVTFFCIPFTLLQNISSEWLRGWRFSPVLLLQDSLEEEYDDVTVKMIFSIVRAVGFFNSFNNPVVYTFTNENFKKSFLAILYCRLQNPEPADRQESQKSERHSMQPSHGASRKEDRSVQSRLSADNLELRLCEQVASTKLESVRSSVIVTYPMGSTNEIMLPSGQSA